MAQTTEEKMYLLSEAMRVDAYKFASNNIGSHVERVLRGDIDMINGIEGLDHHRDCRTYLRYFQELGIGWIVETFLRPIMIRDGWDDVRFSGSDKDRIFLPKEKISSTVDYEMDKDGIIHYADVIADFQGFWERAGYTDLRDQKLPKMKALAGEGKMTWLVCMDVINQKYGYKRIKYDTPSTPKKNQYWGGKPCEVIQLSTHTFKPLHLD